MMPREPLTVSDRAVRHIDELMIAPICLNCFPLQRLVTAVRQVGPARQLGGSLPRAARAVFSVATGR